MGVTLLWNLQLNHCLHNLLQLEGKDSLGQCLFGFKARTRLFTAPAFTEHSVAPRSLCHFSRPHLLIQCLCADQKHVPPWGQILCKQMISGTMRKILFLLRDVGASPGQLKNEFQPPLVPFQLGNLVQGATFPGHQYLLALRILPRG